MKRTRSERDYDLPRLTIEDTAGVLGIELTDSTNSVFERPEDADMWK